MTGQVFELLFFKEFFKEKNFFKDFSTSGYWMDLIGPESRERRLSLSSLFEKSVRDDEHLRYLSNHIQYIR